MKKAMMTMALLLAVLAASAQDDLYMGSQDENVKTEVGDIGSIQLTAGGSYERQTVVEAAGASASVLFERAMIALSDWTGPDGNARAGIDYQNAETHTVIYKGSYSLGFKGNVFGGWYRQADFQLKVRCKDGRAQVTLTVPTITVQHSKNNVSQTNSVKKLLEEVEKAKGDRRKRGEAVVHDLVTTADALVAAMTQRLQDGSDDDF